MIKHIDVIVPCYNEESSLDRFWKESGEAFSAIEGYEFRYIFIDDGSSDETLQKIRRLAALQDSAKADASDASDPDTILGATGDPAPGNPGACPKVSYISFSRNFGKEAAMYAGLQASDGDFAVIMDADLQHPPQLVAEMIRIVEETGCDSCAARRVSRKGEPKIRSALARAFYKLMNRYSDIEIVDGAVDFRLMNRKMVKAIVGMPENQRFSKGIFAWIGFPTYRMPYQVEERANGASKWSLGKLFGYAMEGITAFSTKLLLLPLIAGVILAAGAVLLAVVLKILSVAGALSVTGVGWLAMLLVFLAGVQLQGLGVAAFYLGKLFNEGKGRPVYIERVVLPGGGEGK